MIGVVAASLAGLALGGHSNVPGWRTKEKGFMSKGSQYSHKHRHGFHGTGPNHPIPAGLTESLMTNPDAKAPGFGHVPTPNSLDERIIVGEPVCPGDMIPCGHEEGCAAPTEGCKKHGPADNGPLSSGFAARHTKHGFSATADAGNWNEKDDDLICAEHEQKCTDKWSSWCNDPSWGWECPPVCNYDAGENLCYDNVDWKPFCHQGKRCPATCQDHEEKCIGEWSEWCQDPAWGWPCPPTCDYDAEYTSGEMLCWNSAEETQFCHEGDSCPAICKDNEQICTSEWEDWETGQTKEEQWCSSWSCPISCNWDIEMSCWDNETETEYCFAPNNGDTIDWNSQPRCPAKCREDQSVCSNTWFCEWCSPEMDVTDEWCSDWSCPVECDWDTEMTCWNAAEEKDYCFTPNNGEPINWDDWEQNKCPAICASHENKCSDDWGEWCQEWQCPVYCTGDEMNCWDATTESEYCYGPVNWDDYVQCPAICRTDEKKCQSTWWDDHYGKLVSSQWCQSECESIWQEAQDEDIGMEHGNDCKFWRIEVDGDFYKMQDACVEAGGSGLAVIKNKEQNARALEACPYGGCCLGLNDADEEGHWMWADGTTVKDGYHNWSGGEPNDWGGQEDFGVIWENGMWNDQGCWGQGLCQACGMPDDWEPAVVASEKHEHHDKHDDHNEEVNELEECIFGNCMDQAMACFENEFCGEIVMSANGIVDCVNSLFEDGECYTLEDVAMCVYGSCHMHVKNEEEFQQVEAHAIEDLEKKVVEHPDYYMAEAEAKEFEEKHEEHEEEVNEFEECLMGACMNEIMDCFGQDVCAGIIESETGVIDCVNAKFDLGDCWAMETLAICVYGNCHMKIKEEDLEYVEEDALKHLEKQVEEHPDYYMAGKELEEFKEKETEAIVHNEEQYWENGADEMPETAVEEFNQDTVHHHEPAASYESAPATTVSSTTVENQVKAEAEVIAHVEAAEKYMEEEATAIANHDATTASYKAVEAAEELVAAESTIEAAGTELEHGNAAEPIVNAQEEVYELVEEAYNEWDEEQVALETMDANKAVESVYAAETLLEEAEEKELTVLDESVYTAEEKTTVSEPVADTLEAGEEAMYAIEAAENAVHNGGYSGTSTQVVEELIQDAEAAVEEEIIALEREPDAEVAIQEADEVVAQLKEAETAVHNENIEEAEAALHAAEQAEVAVIAAAAEHIDESHMTAPHTATSPITQVEAAEIIEELKEVAVEFEKLDEEISTLDERLSKLEDNNGEF